MSSIEEFVASQGGAISPDFQNMVRSGGSLFVPRPNYTAAERAFLDERHRAYDEAANARYAAELAETETQRLTDQATLDSLVGQTIATLAIFASDRADGNDPDTIRLTVSDGRSFDFVGEGYDSWGIRVDEVAAS